MAPSRASSSVADQQSAPSPSDQPSRPRPVGGLTFQTPQSDPSPETDPADLADGSPSLSGEPSDELPDEPSDAPRSSSKGSSGSALSKRAVKDAARQAVLITGATAHQLLARDELEQEAGLYLADEDDAEAIGDPLANMANRRGGLGAAGNPDLADAIAALIGLALYVVKQIARWNAVKAARRNRAATPEPFGDAGAGEGATAPHNL